MDVEEFAYPARPSLRVCDNYRLSVKAGETVALVGPSGGGRFKKTIYLSTRNYHEINVDDVRLLFLCLCARIMFHYLSSLDRGVGTNIALLWLCLSCVGGQARARPSRWYVTFQYSDGDERK